MLFDYASNIGNPRKSEVSRVHGKYDVASPIVLWDLGEIFSECEKRYASVFLDRIGSVGVRVANHSFLGRTALQGSDERIGRRVGRNGRLEDYGRLRSRARQLAQASACFAADVQSRDTLRWP